MAIDAGPRLTRRQALAGAAGLCLAAPLAACAPTRDEVTPEAAIAPPGRTAPANLRTAAVYVPGYWPNAAETNGLPLTQNRAFARNIADPEGAYRLLSRIGMDGRITQALLPVHAHDVAVAPDRSVGVLCGFEARDHVAFDPATLDLVATAPAFAEGWRGGGHAEYLADGATVLLSERAPRSALEGGALEDHYGRITIRDADTLRIRDSFSSHGIDPHDIRLIDDGRLLAVANYGSLPPDGETELSVPRDVRDACVALIEVASGRLVERWATGSRDAELRHLAAGVPDRIFAIQARLGDDAARRASLAEVDVAYEYDMTAEDGAAYLPAATLRLARGGQVDVVGEADDIAGMRHGLSIVYDDMHDQAVASYPSAHRLMVFDGPTGRVVSNIDTRTLGLRYPCGITWLPDGAHYAVAGYWENLFVFERGSHRLNRELCLYPQFFGHSHIAAA